MGPKKAVPKPVNYVKKQPGMTRMLKEWYVRHKKYYADFKERIETGLMNNDPKVLDEFKQMLSLFPELQSKNPDEFAKEMISQAPKRFEDYTWDKKKDVLNWVTNDLDATMSEHTRVLAPENLSAWRKFFLEEGLDDNTCATLYWFSVDGGQIFALMALSKYMGEHDLTHNEQIHGELMTRGVVEKGVLTGCYHKNYWEKIFSLKGFTGLKNIVASVLTTTKGKGGRNANIYVLREMITGPDKHAILKNIEGVICARKKDTDLACLLTLLVRTGNVDKDIKYKPFHDAIKSEFPDAGIGTERRPQQLYNNLSMNPQQLLQQIHGKDVKNV